MASTIFTIARKEMLERLVSKRYLVLFAVTAFTMLLAFVSATADFKARLDNYTASVTEGGDYLALQEPSPLSILAQGNGDELSRRFEVDAQLGLIRVSGASVRSSDLFQVLPPIDVLYVIQVILSLVAALLVFDSVAGEKQRGSLSLLLSHPVSRARVFTGKWLGSHVVLATVLVPSFVAGLLWLTAVGGIRLESTAWQRVLAFGLLSTAYLSFFLTLGLMISCFARRPASSSVVVLLVWALLVFVIPSLTAQTAAWRVSLPDAQRMESRNTETWISNAFERVEARREDNTVAGDLAGEVLQSTSGLDRDFFARALRRLRLHGLFALLSPASSLSRGATAIAATGPESELRFKGDLLAYRASVIGTAVAERKPSPLLSKSLAADMTWVQEVVPPFVALVLGIAITFLLGLWTFNRYDAR